MILTDEELNDILAEFQRAAKARGDSSPATINPRVFTLTMRYFERQRELRDGQNQEDDDHE